MKDMRLKALKEIHKLTNDKYNLPYKNAYLKTSKYCSKELFLELVYDGYIDFYRDKVDGYFDISSKGKNYIFDHEHQINAIKLSFAAILISIASFLVSIIAIIYK